MKNITLNLPNSVDLDENELKIFVAAKLYEMGKLSLGQAAEVAGLSKRAFAEMLGKYNVSLFNYPASDLEEDIKNA